MCGAVRSARKIPANPERVCDRLAYSVALRDIEVLQRRLVATDLHHVEHVVGALERCRAIEVGRDAGGRTKLPCCCSRYCLGRVEAVGVDVVQCDLDRLQLREREDVAEQMAGEDDAAGSHERDACQAARLPSRNRAILGRAASSRPRIETVVRRLNTSSGFWASS